MRIALLSALLSHERTRFDHLSARRPRHPRDLAIVTQVLVMLVLVALLASCATTSGSTSAIKTPTVTTPSPIPTLGPPPAHYTARILLHGGQPDDLTFDRSGSLLYDDVSAGTISRLNADGSSTMILRGISGPEGMVVLADGTLIVAEQNTNRILAFPPGATSPTILRTLPGQNSAPNCKHGVDGIGFDAATTTLLVPDSPTGAMYRMSTDGKVLTLLATGITRPVGAVEDDSGTIWVADECGAAVWRISSAGQATRLGGFGMPDDVELDPQGDVLVIDLDGAIHALLRIDRDSGKHETLASAELREPQGLAVDAKGDIFVADETAQEIVEYVPSS